MPKPKKTIKVAPLVAALNVAIQARSGHREEQGALCWVMEKVLMDADAYRGFQHAKNGEIMPLERRQTIDPDDPDWYSRSYYAPRYET